MQINILLCAAAILTVTQSTPIAVARNDVKNEKITNQKIAGHVQNPADFVAVKAPISKRQFSGQGPSYSWNAGLSPQGYNFGGNYKFNDQNSAFGSSNFNRDFSFTNANLGYSRQLDSQSSLSGTVDFNREGFNRGGLEYSRQLDDASKLSVSGGISGTGDYQTMVTYSNDDGCLYGDDFVLIQDGSRKQLKNLRSGDKVYSVDRQGKLVKDEIIMMLHGGPKIEAAFYTLTTSSNRTISLTPHHLIMKHSPEEKRSQMVAANELKAGDYLLMSHKQQTEPVRITSIELLYKTGIYTPMTYQGTLFVNDIAVSCYVKYFNKYNELHTLLYPLRFYYYLIKDVLGLNEEPFAAVPSLADDQFYGIGMIRWLHQSKNMVRFVGQDLLINTVLSI